MYFCLLNFVFVNDKLNLKLCNVQLITHEVHKWNLAVLVDLQLCAWNFEDVLFHT